MSSIDVGLKCKLCGTPIADCGVRHDGLCCGCEDRRVMHWPSVSEEAAALTRIRALYAQFDRERASEGTGGE